MSTNAGSSGFKLYLGAETVWGTIVPTASVANAIRVTGGAGKTGTETMMSKEVSTYEASDVVRTRVTGGGSYNFELSYETADKGMDLVLGSVFGSAYGANVMKVGSTLKFFSLTEKYSDLASPVIREYAGCVAESYRLDIRPGDAITGSFSFVSKKEVDSTTMTMVTPQAANTSAVMNPLDSIQTLKWGGASVVGCTAFSMEFRRPVIQLPQLSSVDPTELLSGTFEASGSMSLYLQNTTAGLADYLAFTERALEITLGGAASKKYLFNFPKCNFTDGGIESLSKDSPVIQTFNWSAKGGDALTTCQVTRTP